VAPSEAEEVEKLLPVLVTSWNAPTGCPAQTALTEALSEELTHTAPSELVELEVAVEIQAQGGEYRLVLAVDDGLTKTRRELASRNCRAAVLAAAFSLAMVVEQAEELTTALLRVAEDPQNETPSVAFPRTSLRSARSDNDEAIVYRSSPSAPKPALLVAVGTEAGLMPGAGLSLSVGAAGHFGRLRVETRGTYWMPRQSTQAGPGVSLSLLSLPLWACYQFIRGVDVAPCAGLELGVFQARGRDVVTIAEASFIQVAPTIALTATLIRVGTVRVIVAAALAMQVRRPAFTVLPDRVVHQPSWLNARFFMAPEWSF